MRTTLTLDDDVAARLKAAVKRQRRPFRSVVNDALRAGLAALGDRRRPKTAHHTTGFNLGASLVGSLDNVEDVLLRVEGERHR
ncbi:MAG: DUF2191 domain-containing protein [Vicinamibacterales bacterium]